MQALQNSLKGTGHPASARAQRMRPFQGACKLVLPQRAFPVVLAASPDQEQPSVSRRDALTALVAGLVILPQQAAFAGEAAAIASTSGSTVKEFYDPILAYKFQYPTLSVSGKQLSMIIARAPEKYSSAPPLSADARQRIVSEIVDFKNFITVSMTVGPASGVLKEREPSEWKAKEVALTVLIDRSTARVSSGQRVALNDVEAARKEDREGQPYWVYEHLSQGSPTIRTRERETFRHALAVTTVRPGLDGQPFLYTLNIACPQEAWEDLEPVFQEAVSSFRLVGTTKDYIPPDRNPWLFF